ncbi:MAG: group I intron-associated PD-(D/E)XK endonuclease [Actinomycetota bacterium]|nr:group I intron-associated PD-(D/E)XK endonuclease [Actinomycetota bacterium]
MNHPKDIGDCSTLAVMLVLRGNGYVISVPFGENTRYDLIADDGHRLLRVQCKTGRFRHGSVVFRPSSSYAHHASPRVTRQTYGGQIDYFGVYCLDSGGVYLVPIDEITTTWMAMLRVDPARNGQRKRIRLAADYQIGTVSVPALSVRRAPRASSGARGSCA